MGTHRAMRISVVDVGSNTVRLVVADAQDGVPLPVHTAKWRLRLSDDVRPGGPVPQEAVERLVKAVEEADRTAARWGAAGPLAFATAVVRAAPNRQEVLRTVRQRTGVACQLDLPADGPAVAPPVALTMFRIVQEALTNVARHANAHHVRIGLTVDPEAAVLTLTDDGRGVTAEELERPTSLGIVGIRERALAVGGQVTFTGTAERGTTVPAGRLWTTVHGLPTAATGLRQPADQARRWMSTGSTTPMTTMGFISSRYKNQSSAWGKPVRVVAWGRCAKVSGTP